MRQQTFKGRKMGGGDQWYSLWVPPPKKKGNWKLYKIFCSSLAILWLNVPYPAPCKQILDQNSRTLIRHQEEPRKNEHVFLYMTVIVQMDKDMYIFTFFIEMLNNCSNIRYMIDTAISTNLRLSEQSYINLCNSWSIIVYFKTSWVPQ